MKDNRLCDSRGRWRDERDRWREAVVTLTVARRALSFARECSRETRDGWAEAGEALRETAQAGTEAVGRQSCAEAAWSGDGDAAPVAGHQPRRSESSP